MLGPDDTLRFYVLINRRFTIIKMIHYERGFYVLYEKRSEIGRFRKPVYDSKTERVCSRIRKSII